ncbi:MAG: hypothetical protein HKN09_08970 [Saprospiraceae bacterium]|nr:hypothetical protein [Saprospiraceae bacterium]
MNFTEEHIWAYLDGTLDVNLVQQFLHAMEEDQALMKQYHTASALHSALGKVPVKSAPRTMLANIIKQIKPRKSYVKNYASFTGLFKVLAVCAGIITLLCALIYLGANNMGDITSDGVIANFVTASQESLTPHLNIMQYAPYSLVIVCVLILLYLDKFLKSKFAQGIVA